MNNCNQSWNFWYNLAYNYYNKYGNLNMKPNFKTLDGINYDANGYALKKWLYRQNKYKDKLTKEQIEKLNKIGFKFKKFKPHLSFLECYDLLVKYYNKNGNILLKESFYTFDGINYDKEGYNLFYYIEKLKNDYEKLNDNEKKLLEKINFETNNIRDIKWMQHYKLAINYHNTFGNLDIKQDFKTKDGIHQDDDGFALGDWVRRQRFDKNLTPKRKELLDKIGIKYEKKVIRTNLSWDECFDIAKKYFQEHGTSEIPTNYICENGFKLGKWIASQRKRFDSLPIYKQTKLKEINLRTDIKLNDIIWNNYYSIALIYYNTHKNLDMEKDFKTLDGISYDEKGYNLHKWICNQKNNHNLKQDKIEKLKLIGIEIKEKITPNSWDESFILATNYFKKHGNLEIPHSFKTKNGYTYDKDGYALGNWVSIQRIKQDKLTEDKRNKLLSIGMRFNNIRIINEKIKMPWDNWYSIAVTYFKQHGHLKIPANYITKEGYRLGWWLVNQRNNNKLSEDRIMKLNYIGMIWKYKKNISNLTELLNTYNIDLNKNKEIINRSYIEVYSKIKYLIENNINLTNNNGELNPIFYMSDINLEAIYNINIKYLINKYSNNIKTKKK